MYDERRIDMPDGPFTVRAGIDEHPTVELPGYGLFPQAVIAAANFWPDFLEQTRHASTLRRQVGPLISEMPIAGAYAVLLEALRRARILADQLTTAGSGAAAVCR
jgi:hypothetical protein